MKSSGGGVGFFGLLGVLFIGLKLTHFIDWRWRWVLAPLWGPAAAFIVAGLVLLFVWLAVKALEVVR